MPYNVAILFLCIYLRGMKTYVHTKTCIQIIVAVLFIIAKPEYPTLGKWIDKQLYIPYMKHYSGIKRNETLISQQRGCIMPIKYIMLSE